MTYSTSTNVTWRMWRISRFRAKVRGRDKGLEKGRGGLEVDGDLALGSACLSKSEPYVNPPHHVTSCPTT